MEIDYNVGIKVLKEATLSIGVVVMASLLYVAIKMVTLNYQ